MFPHAHTPLPIPVLSMEEKKHFPPIISLDYIFISNSWGFPLESRRAHSAYTTKITVFFFFFSLRLGLKFLGRFLIKIRNKNFIWLQKKGGSKEVKKERKKREKRVPTIFCWPLFCIKTLAWLNDEFWRLFLSTFSISSYPFLFPDWHCFLPVPLIPHLSPSFVERF